MPRVSTHLPSFRVSNHNYTCISLLSQVSHMPNLSTPISTLIIFGEDYNWWSSSLCSVLQSLLTSSFIGSISSTSSTAHYCQTPSLVWEVKFHTQVQLRQNYAGVQPEFFMGRGRGDPEPPCNLSLILKNYVIKII
jgi:hypothetical protein